MDFPACSRLASKRAAVVRLLLLTLVRKRLSARRRYGSNRRGCTAKLAGFLLPLAHRSRQPKSVSLLIEAAAVKQDLLKRLPQVYSFSSTSWYTRNIFLPFRIINEDFSILCPVRVVDLRPLMQIPASTHITC